MEAFVRWIAARIGVALTATVVLALIGAVSLLTLPVDAVPDVTNNQVQVVTAAPALAPAEVERTITLPVERAMAGTPGLKEVRSISKLGISVVTLIFRDDIDVYFARQQVGERLVDVRDRIPKGSGTPELGPIATGLGEIFMFVLEGPTFTPEELRTTMDWVIGPKLRQVKGVIETVHFGGELKQFRITLDPQKLAAHKVSLEEVRAALERDNQNAGGGTIEKSGEQLVLRAEARFRNLDEINDSVVKTQEGGVPLTLGMLGEIDTGPALRQGSMTMNGKGEVVAGFVLLLKGENSRDVVHRVKTEVDNVNKVLPKGMRVVPFLDRASFIERTVATVVRNLFEGAGVVVVVLLLTLGSLRAGLLVSGAIPFAMLVAFTGLRLTGMSANVMSLGAVDFGIVVEGAVVMVEGALHAAAHQGDRAKKRAAIVDACAVTARPVLFAVIIVLLVFLPLATLEDVEGKMFRPVVVSLVFMLAGALFYALVLVPALAPSLLGKFDDPREPRLVRLMRRFYEPALARVVARPKVTVVVALVITAACIAPGLRLGAEFLPRIFEGDFALDVRRPISTGVGQATELSLEKERVLLREVPEVIKVVTRTGRTEGSVDPQGPEGSDVFVILRPREEWRPGLTPEKLAEEIDKKLEGHSPGEFVAVSQPIEMRVNDLIAGVKSDVALKIYGDDLQEMSQLAEKLQAAIAGTPGAADVKREIPWGLPTIRVRINREKAARLGVAPKSILDAIEVARAGQKVGEIYEGERVFDLVLKISGDALKSEVDLARFPVQTMGGEMVPLSAVADIKVERGIFQITRDKLRRRLVVEANVRGRDLVGFVNDAKQRVAQVPVPPGIELAWGGQFENFQRANERLMMLVPVALGIIAVMLYLSYRSVLLTMCTLLSLPFALGGGLVSLFARGMPFSIPAMVGFIALAGVAVMSGVVLTTRLLDSGDEGSPEARVREAASSAFRPTISTALVAALGFIPMAIAKSAGAEVQRPLATVVIGGLLVGVVGSVLAMPAMLVLVMRRKARLAKPPVAPAEPGAAPTAESTADGPPDASPPAESPPDLAPSH